MDDIASECVSERVRKGEGKREREGGVRNGKKEDIT